MLLDAKAAQQQQEQATTRSAKEEVDVLKCGWVAGEGDLLIAAMQRRAELDIQPRRGICCRLDLLVTSRAVQADDQSRICCPLPSLVSFRRQIGTPAAAKCTRLPRVRGLPAGSVGQAGALEIQWRLGSGFVGTEGGSKGAAVLLKGSRASPPRIICAAKMGAQREGADQA